MHLHRINSVDILTKHNQLDYELTYMHLIDKDYLNDPNVEWYEAVDVFYDNRMIQYEENEIKGLVALRRNFILPLSVHISCIEIRKNIRGMGFGKLIIKEVERGALEQGYRSITLRTKTDDLVPFYEALDFKSYDPPPDKVRYFRKYLSKLD